MSARPPGPSSAWSRSAAWSRTIGALFLLILGFRAPSASSDSDWAWLARLRDSARSPEMNRADREANAGGYYEGLISGTGSDGGRNELALKLLGKPSHWVRFHEADLARPLPADFLQFELQPNLERTFFDAPFTTNADGFRDRPYAHAKAPNTFRILLLGSSIDMGWGVATNQTYENLWEEWLNTHARLRGLPRRFEVVNLAVAAYGPAQRLEQFRRRAETFDPDLVLYSSTMLDPRLTEIHLCNLLLARIDPGAGHPAIVRAFAETGLGSRELPIDPKTGDLKDKASIKAKLQPWQWPVIEGSIDTLAAECRSRGIPLWGLIVPRVGKADAPEARNDTVARFERIHHERNLPLLDLAGSFDHHDPAGLEIAPWDDHPNTIGHRRLFRVLARAFVARPDLYQQLFADETVPTHRGVVSDAR